MSQNERGSVSITVEAAILMPLLIMLIVLMLMFAMFIYEQAAMRSVCDYIAVEAAKVWPQGQAYMETYFEEGAESASAISETPHIINVYADYVTNLGGVGKADKIKRLEQEGKKRAEAFSLIKNTGFDITISLKNYVLKQKLEVNLKTEYDLLFYKDQLDLTSISVIQDQAEGIRMIDFAADLVSQMEGVDKVTAKYNECVDKLIKTINEKLGEK